MTIFKLGTASVVCESYSRGRQGFGHRAILLIGGTEACRATCSYINRTWERYTYQSVFHKVLDKTDRLTDAKIKRFKKKYVTY